MVYTVNGYSRSSSIARWPRSPRKKFLIKGCEKAITSFGAPLTMTFWSASTAIRVLSSNKVSRSCVTITTVSSISRCRERSSAQNLSELSGSSPAVASDAMPVSFADGSIESTDWPLPAGGSTHPRTAGTFARTLRQMVRESGAWSWVEAFRRCSYLPARVLDGTTPAAAGKGRLAAGADADLVVLDPARITDTATYLDPTRPSVGIRQLLVAGTFVVRDGALDPTAHPGRGLRGAPR